MAQDKPLGGTEAGALFGAIIGALRGLGFSREQIEAGVRAVNDAFDKSPLVLGWDQPPKPPGD